MLYEPSGNPYAIFSFTEHGEKTATDPLRDKRGGSLQEIGTVEGGATAPTWCNHNNIPTIPTIPSVNNFSNHQQNYQRCRYRDNVSIVSMCEWHVDQKQKIVVDVDASMRPCAIPNFSVSLACIATTPFFIRPVTTLPVTTNTLE